MLERLAPPGIAIIEMGLSNFPTGKAKQSKKWDQLRQPERSARKERRKQLWLRRQFRELMKNFLRRSTRRYGRTRRRRWRRSLRRRSGRHLRRGPAFHPHWDRFAAQGDVLLLRVDQK